jgi:hypothetical protein
VIVGVRFRQVPNAHQVRYSRAVALTGVELVLQGRRGAVEVSRVTDSLTKTVGLLHEIDRFYAYRIPRLKWVVQEAKLETEQLSFTITPREVPKRRNEESAAVPARALVEGVEVLHERAEIPPFFGPSSVERVADLATQGRGVHGVSIRTFNGGTQDLVPLDTDVITHARSAITGKTTSLGSVVGVLDVISLRKRPRAAIFDPSSRRAVSIYFEAIRLEEIKGLLGKRVLAGGPLTRNDFGQAVQLRLEVIEEFAVPRPDIDALAGLDPDWIGGANVDEWVAAGRRES